MHVAGELADSCVSELERRNFTSTEQVGLPVIFRVAAFTALFSAGCGFATCFTARFAVRFTAATAPFTELLTDLTVSLAAFRTFFSMELCAASFSAFDLWRRSAEWARL